MITLGIDLGNKSRNSIAVIDENENVLEWSRITYDGKTTTPLEHRKTICKQIRAYIKKYHLTKKDYLVFEKVNLFMGGHISKLSNIMSLAFIQATIINEFSKSIQIVEVPVVTWKSKVLGTRQASKSDSVAFVEKRYPEIDLTIFVPHKRKADEYIKDNDTADAICIGIYGQREKTNELQKRLVNFT